MPQDPRPLKQNAAAMGRLQHLLDLIKPHLMLRDPKLCSGLDVSATLRSDTYVELRKKLLKVACLVSDKPDKSYRPPHGGHDSVKTLPYLFRVAQTIYDHYNPNNKYVYQDEKDKFKIDGKEVPLLTHEEFQDMKEQGTTQTQQQPRKCTTSTTSDTVVLYDSDGTGTEDEEEYPPTSTPKRFKQAATTTTSSPATEDTTTTTTTTATTSSPEAATAADTTTSPLATEDTTTTTTTSSPEAADTTTTTTADTKTLEALRIIMADSKFDARLQLEPEYLKMESKHLLGHLQGASKAKGVCAELVLRGTSAVVHVSTPSTPYVRYAFDGGSWTETERWSDSTDVAAIAQDLLSSGTGHVVEPQKMHTVHEALEFLRDARGVLQHVNSWGGWKGFTQRAELIVYRGDSTDTMFKVQGNSATLRARGPASAWVWENVNV